MALLRFALRRFLKNTDHRRGWRFYGNVIAFLFTVESLDDGTRLAKNFGPTLAWPWTPMECGLIEVQPFGPNGARPSAYDPSLLEHPLDSALANKALPGVKKEVIGLHITAQALLIINVLQCDYIDVSPSIDTHPSRLQTTGNAQVHRSRAY